MNPAPPRKNYGLIQSSWKLCESDYSNQTDIFPPSGFYEKLGGMLQVLRKWYWSAAWGRKFPYLPMIWLKLLMLRVIANASQSDVKIGQTNEISRYIHTWPWQIPSSVPGTASSSSPGPICTATDSITEAQAEDSRQNENENVNVSRVFHWSR